MTKEQFETIGFYKGMKVMCYGNIYDVGGVDFDRGCIQIVYKNNWEWVHYSNVEVVL